MLHILIVYSFLLLSSIPLYGYITICLFIHLWKDIYFGCFQFGATANKAAMSIFVEIFYVDVCFHFS